MSDIDLYAILLVFIACVATIMLVWQIDSTIRNLRKRVEELEKQVEKWMLHSLDTK